MWPRGSSDQLGKQLGSRPLPSLHTCRQLGDPGGPSQPLGSSSPGSPRLASRARDHVVGQGRELVKRVSTRPASDLAGAGPKRCWRHSHLPGSESQGGDFRGIMGLDCGPVRNGRWRRWGLIAWRASFLREQIYL